VPFDLVLESGTTVGSLVSRQRPSVILFYQPGDCFTCNATMPEYLALQQAEKVHVVLIFTRPMTADETRRIAFLRLPVAGTLRASERVPAREFLVVGGRVKAVSGDDTSGPGTSVLKVLRQELATSR